MTGRSGGQASARGGSRGLTAVMEEGKKIFRKENSYIDKA